MISIIYIYAQAVGDFLRPHLKGVYFMKRFLMLLTIAAFMAGQNATNKQQNETGGYKYIEAVATSAAVLTLDDGEQIQLYNGDLLSVSETYILMVDPLNDNELLNYWDLETYELEHME